MTFEIQGKVKEKSENTLMEIIKKLSSMNSTEYIENYFADDLYKFYNYKKKYQNLHLSDFKSKEIKENIIKSDKLTLKQAIDLINSKDKITENSSKNSLLMPTIIGVFGTVIIGLFKDNNELSAYLFFHLLFPVVVGVLFIYAGRANQHVSQAVKKNQDMRILSNIIEDVVTEKKQRENACKK